MLGRLAKFWRGRSRRNKARLIIYPSLIFVIVGLGYWTMAMPGKSHRGALMPLTSQERAVALLLERDVRALADEKGGGVGERHLDRSGTMESARTLIEGRFKDAGYEPIALGYQ